MTTTRYAIELEPGKYVTDDIGGAFSIKTASLFLKHKAKNALAGYKKYHLLARIVRVKCEVVDE